MALSNPLAAVRYVAIQQGDTLQKIAARELGDATRWPDLITINNLSFPYLTGDVEVALTAEGIVKLYGDSLLVPATLTTPSSTDDPVRVFGADIQLLKGRLMAGPNGDLALVSGSDNLDQAISNRIETPLGELVFHQDYGCGIHRLKGRGGDVGAVTLAGKYVESALLDDPRIDAVPVCTATINGDSISVNATVQPITGASTDLSKEL